MKNANLFLLFIFGFFTISTNGQSYFPKENIVELQPVLDTLPDGTVIDLFDGTIVENTLAKIQLKSVTNNVRPLAGKPTTKNKQLNTKHKKQLKSAQFIKSLNQETSPYYKEKLDSIVEYEPTMVTSYDSIGSEKEKLKYNENGYLVESIVDTLDRNTGAYLKKEKIEYTPDAEGRLRKSLTFNWTGEVWAVSKKHEQEYNASGNTTLSVDYIWGGSDWMNSSKTEYEFNTNGNITSNARYIGSGYDWIGNYRYEYTYHESGERATYDYYGSWDVTENMWTREGKSEYNEQGQRTMSSFKIFNTQTKEWEYSYKYEYEYLEDESIVETRYGWNTETKELYVQYEKRYKYEREYDGDNVAVEIKLNFENENWEYEYKIERKYDGNKLEQEIKLNYYGSWQEVYRKEYEHDQWGNETLYELYDANWWGEITERRIAVYTESGQRIKYEWYRWEIDEEYGWFKKIGVGFYEYIKGADGKTLSYDKYKWNEESEEWVLDFRDHYSYPKEGEMIREQYNFNVDGYYPSFEQDGVIMLTYDTKIGKYSGLIEKYPEYDEEYETQITYNEDLKVDEMLYVEEGIVEEKMKCYYDALGRDTAWYDYNWVDGTWQIYGKVLFTYEDMGSEQIKVTEHWQSNSQYESDNYYIYIIQDGKIMEVYDRRYSNENGELVPRYDTTNYQYNTLGQITSILDRYGDDSWKTDYQLINDTLIVEYLYGDNSDATDWIQGEREVYKVDTNFSKNQFQQIPAVVFEGYQWAYEWHSVFDYGKILEGTNYGRDYNTKELEINGKSVFYYSHASPLQGETTISGYVFDETGAEKSVSVTTQESGVPVSGVAVLLCSQEDDYVLATDTTDTEGFYEFKGVPVGNFYLKVEIDGYEQTSTHEIIVTRDATKIENKNFKVQNGEVFTGIDEIESGIKIYPNPAFNFVNITATEEIISVRVLDIGGNTKIESNDINSTQINISTYKLPIGLYIFEIKTNSLIYNKKIIVKK